MTTETYPQQMPRFTTRQFRVHLTCIAMSATTGCLSTVERRRDACQQVCYTGLKIQHRDWATDRHTTEHVPSTISPNRTLSITTRRRRSEAEVALTCCCVRKINAFADNVRGIVCLKINKYAFTCTAYKSCITLNESWRKAAKYNSQIRRTNL
jgi:hypothetical protein